MIRDITIGQYYPVDSPIHRLDPRTKLFGTMIYIISLFFADNLWCYLIATLFLTLVVRLSKVPFKFIVKGLKAIVFLLLISVSFNLFLTDGREIFRLSMMMSIALRFIPILIEETDKIMKAQMARGADFETGNLMQRAKSMIPLLVPLFVSAFRRATDLAMAMEARCYRGGAGRTKMKPLHYEKRDRAAYAVFIIYLAAVIAVRIIM